VSKDKDKNSMATAVTTSSNAPEDSRGNKPAVESVRSGNPLSVYKPGEGYATRLGLMVVIFAYMIFAARQWYYNWVFIRNVFESIGLGFLTNWTANVQGTVQVAGTAVVALTGMLLGYYYIYIKPQTAEFLIKTDTELGKVTWPKISPWFKADTQVWGATYVVLIVIGVLTLYVFSVDVILKRIADFIFYSK
jgi:preprotein translocase subunit SecE